LHQDKRVVIDRVLRTEFITGLDRLNQSTEEFFRDNANQLLALSINSKMQ